MTTLEVRGQRRPAVEAAELAAAPRLVRKVWVGRRKWIVFFVRLTGSWPEAEDLFSELLLHLWQLEREPRFHSASYEGQWLVNQARHLAWNRSRRERRRALLRAEAYGPQVPWTGVDPDDEATDPHCDPAAEAVERIEADAWAARLRALAPRHRRLLAEAAAGDGLRAMARRRRWGVKRVALALAEARAALLALVDPAEAEELLASLSLQQPAAARRTRTLLAARGETRTADRPPDDES